MLRTGPSFPENLLRDIDLKTPKTMPSDITPTLMYLIYAKLHDREREIILMRYIEKMTYKTIAQKFNVTPSRIRQTITKAIFKLRREPEIRELGFKEIYSQYRELRNFKRNIDDKLSEIYNEGYQAGYNDNHSEYDPKKTLDEIDLEKSINDLNLSMRAYNGLRRAGIHDIATLIKTPLVDIFYKNNIGKKTISEIYAVTTEYLGYTPPDWKLEPYMLR